MVFTLLVNLDWGVGMLLYLSLLHYLSLSNLDYLTFQSFSLYISFSSFLHLLTLRFFIYYMYYLHKGTVAPDFVAPFLACKDWSGQEKQPLLVFQFSISPLIFGSHFKD